MIKIVWLKDFMAELYTWKSMAWLLIASVVFSITSYLLLTDKELSLLDQTEMLWLFGKIIIGAALLVVIIHASSLITSEFENETAENLFLSPLTMRDFVIGKLLAALSLWVLVYVVSVPYMLVTSAGSGLTLAFVGYVALFGTLCILSFALLAFAVSFPFRSMKNTLTTTLVVMFALSVPAFFSSTLKNNAAAAGFARINPVDNVFSALDNILVDYHTQILQNMTYLLPVVVFCVLMTAALVFSAKIYGGRVIAGD